MDDLKIAQLHAATKSVYDRSQALSISAAGLQADVSAGRYQGDVPLQEKTEEIASRGCALIKEALDLESEVRAHQNFYPTRAIFFFRLWRVRDAVGFAYAAQSYASMLAGKEAEARSSLALSVYSHELALDFERQARQAEQDLLTRKR